MQGIEQRRCGRMVCFRRQGDDVNPTKGVTQHLLCTAMNYFVIVSISYDIVIVCDIARIMFCFVFLHFSLPFCYSVLIFRVKFFL